MKIKILLISAMVLSACTAQPSPSLDEKLAGKTPEEQEEILRVACLDEAEHFSNPSGKEIRTPHGVLLNQDSAQTRRLKTVCREMGGAHSTGR